jgi:adenylate cyclase
MAPVRRLTAILAADVAGYSRLMGADEEETHARLRAHLQEPVNPKIKEHRDRVVKHTGDGFLAEFPSVVDAGRCAVEVQRGMADRELDVPDERRIRFRIGLNRPRSGTGQARLRFRGLRGAERQEHRAAGAGLLGS